MVRNAARVASQCVQEREAADDAALESEPGHSDEAWAKRETARAEELHALRMLHLAVLGAMAAEEGRTALALEASLAVTRGARKTLRRP